MAKFNFKEIVSKFKKRIKKENEEIRLNEKKQLFYFLGGFILFYLLISIALTIVPQEIYKQLVGNSVEGILNLSGMKTISQGFVPCNEFSWFSEGIEGTCYSFLVSGKTILIAWLCTGLLEIIILISAIIASFGIKNREKLIGIVLAIIVGAVFNLFRIVFTIQIALTQNIGVIEFAHDILFKLVLFVYITVFYVAWFYWAKNK